MPILDFEKFLFRLHPEKLAPKLRELVGLAEKEVLHELHPAISALSHTEAVTLQAACEYRLHALTTTGMPRPSALENTVESLEKMRNPRYYDKLPVPQINPAHRGKDIHPVVDHVVGQLQSGSGIAGAFQEAAQMTPDVLQQLKNELRATQHEMFSSGNRGEKIRAHVIDEFLASLEAGELIPKKGKMMVSNDPVPYKGPPLGGH